MTDHDALLAAICNEPEEDTPRLALADWLDENGEPERAAFVRAQIELARTPPWEPFAVLCRWRQRDWHTGEPFRPSLPPVDGWHVEWHEEAFHRGLGWRLNVRSLVAWDQTERAILGRAPVGAMHLWSAATLDDWRHFAASPIMRNLREVHLVASPIEPLRALRESPHPPPVADLYFERASGAGIAFVVEELLASPLARTLRGLHFHMGYASLEDLVETISGVTAIERLSFDTMGLTGELMRRTIEPMQWRELRELDLSGNPLGNDVWDLVHALPETLQSLSLAATSLTGQAYQSLEILQNLRRLDLSRNRLSPRLAKALARGPWLTGIRSLNLSRSRVGERELRWLTLARFWPNLVELDLRENPIPRAGVRHLLDAPIPVDLTALVLTGDTLGQDSREELRRKFGERVVFVESEVVGI
jgi:uncharacterized protein (TIGR02996 family)